MMRTSSSSACWLITALAPALLNVGCAAGGDSESGDGSGGLLDGSGDADGDGTPDGTEDGDDDLDLADDVDLSAPPTAGCGNGVLTEDEACDDANQVSGDGCGGNCRYQEVGFSCSPPGAPCQRIARCGDGFPTFPELCDDGNTTAGDGCSATCKVEVGYKCDASTPSQCTPTICGDGAQEGAESCEDSNALPYDGCSDLCQAEPDCSTGSCTSECGDGLVIGEECDDGNRTNGDGCSESCTIEPGFECRQGSCDPEDPRCALRISSIFRDFSESHPDFGVGCDGLSTGIVQDELDTESKPVLANGGGACIESSSSFSQWYRDLPGTNGTNVGSIVLWPNGRGGFVNRYGENGERWGYFDTYTWAANTYEECAASGCVPCDYNPDQGCTASDYIEYDGNPLFFPVDDAANKADTSTFPAKIPAQYGYDAWPFENTIIPGAPDHNFSFTTEVKYWFRFDAAGEARLDFLGDDDVWVFVNGHLAVDLGGVHVPLDGALVVNAASAATYGLEDGKVYPITVFHAERKQEGSSFKLTLAGFNAARSECTPICGDGVVGLGEECDDGVNDGGYGECGSGCRLGEFCGDGVVQPGEECDDGNNIDGTAAGRRAAISGSRSRRGPPFAPARPRPPGAASIPRPSRLVRTRPRLASEIEETVREAWTALAPRGDYAVWRVQSRTADALTVGERTLTGRVAGFLGEAERVGIFVVTIGSAISGLAARTCSAGNALRGLVLDALGSWAAEASVEELMRAMEAGLSPAEGLSLRYSPGYYGMRLEEQRGSAACP